MASINSDPHKTLADVAKLSKLFLAFEVISLAAAVRVVNNPREGNASMPYKKARGKKGGNMAKKSKQAWASSNSDTGGHKKFKKKKFIENLDMNRLFSPLVYILKFFRFGQYLAF
jgi:hypothetical protein